MAISTAARAAPAGAAMLHARRPPVLLGMADYYGTLAAARALGRAGVEVGIADRRWLVPARWSRFATRALACPDPEAAPDAYVAWLLSEAEPGQVLFATSDDLAWLYAEHRDALARRFLLYQPGAEAIGTLLNKWRLHGACRAVGLDVPDTWLPADEAELAALAARLSYPVMVKPQTQVLLFPHQKGRVVRSADALSRLYGEFQAATRHAPQLLARDPGAASPLVQAFVEGTRGVYGISGFVDETGDLFVAAASRKLLQRPRMMGVGLCFEEAERSPALEEGLSALCRRAGYHGPFEAEFLELDGRRVLIDFNPRFYGQLAFDVDRGLDLPRLAYLGALGDRAGLRAAVADARRAVAARTGRVYCHRIQLEVFLALMRVAGTSDRADAARWRGWRTRAAAVTDPMISADDRLPAVVEALSVLWHTVRHARSALRSAAER